MNGTICPDGEDMTFRKNPDSRAGAAHWPPGWLIIFILSLFMLSCAQQGRDPHLVQIYSLRGSLLPAAENGVYVGGIGLAAGASARLKETHPEDEFIVLGTYNLTYGTPEAFITEGMPIIDLMNLMGVDAMVVGVREFYFGPEVLKRQAQRAAFPFLAANLMDAAGLPLSYLRGSYLHEESGIGIIGLAPPYLMEQNLPEHVEGLRLEDPLAAVEREVQVLKLRGSRKIWVIGGGWGEMREEGPDETILRIAALPGVDLVLIAAAEGVDLGLHDIPGLSAKVLAVRGDLAINGREIDHYDPNTGIYETIPVNSTAHRVPDYIEPALSGVYNSTRELLNRTVSRAPEAIPHNFDAESSLGNFITDSLREQLGTEILMINSGGMRNGFEAGAVTVRDIYNAYPFGGNLIEFSLDAEILRQILRHSLSYIERPERGRGFLQVSGISFDYEAGPQGYRLIEDSIRVGDRELEDGREYRAAVERFLFNGGDGYLAFQGIEAEKVHEESTLSLLIDLVEKKETLSAHVDGRMRLR